MGYMCVRYVLRGYYHNKYVYNQCYLSACQRKSYIISNIKKVRVFANGFLKSLGARPLNQSLLRFKDFSSEKIKCQEIECFSVRPIVCSFARIIQKGCVMAVESMPAITPELNLLKPNYFSYSQIMQQKPPNVPSLMHDASPPLKKADFPYFLQISIMAPRIDVYPWKSASQKRVQITLSGLVTIVLNILEMDETKKFLPADCYSSQKYLNPAKQMQQPNAAFKVAADIPLQNPFQPSLLLMYREMTQKLQAGLLERASYRGGSINPILMFQKGCSTIVVITPLTIPHSPFSLIINLNFYTQLIKTIQNHHASTILVFSQNLLN